MSLHIRHFTPTFFHPTSVLGGGERYVHELARFQASLGAQVEVISCGPRRHDLVLDGLGYQIFPAYTAGRFTRDNPWSLGALRALAGADIAHIHQVSMLLGDLAAIQGYALNQPVFVTDHGGGGGTVLHRRLPITGAYTAGIGQSRVALDLLHSKPCLRTVHIPGGVDLARFRPPAPGSPREGVLFVGRLLQHKGVHVLVEALQHLPEGVPLRIVGRVADPAYLARLQALAQGRNVTFIHDADDRRLVTLYQSAEIVVLPSVPEVAGQPSYAELMGFTLLEAQACGTPVVCSDTGGMAQFVCPGVSGEITPAGDPVALADALAKILAAGPAYQAGTRAWVEPLGWESVARQHLALYQAALDEEVSA